jgi:hypothetical protein
LLHHREEYEGHSKPLKIHKQSRVMHEEVDFLWLTTYQIEDQTNDCNLVRAAACNIYTIDVHIFIERLVGRYIVYTKISNSP